MESSGDVTISVAAVPEVELGTFLSLGFSQLPCMPLVTVVWYGTSLLRHIVSIPRGPNGKITLGRGATEVGKSSCLLR